MRARQARGRVLGGGACQGHRLARHVFDRKPREIAGGDDRGARALRSAQQRPDAQDALARLFDEVDLVAAHARREVVALDQNRVGSVGAGGARAVQGVLNDLEGSVTGRSTHPCVPPTVRSSTRIVGRPTPTGTL
jgi:hypothetical protein